jgi:hypothetical protein
MEGTLTMSIIIHPRHATGNRHTPPDAGGKTRFWVGVAIATLLLLLVGIIELLRARESGRNREKMASAAVAVTLQERPPAPVAAAPDRLRPDEQPRVADPEAPMRDLRSQAPVINAGEIERMQMELRRNEALPPEERRALAPTPDMIRTLYEERGVLQ